MYLKRLEISGFKSFAHKTVLEFDRSVTAIVGPNGSGKSNIADAVRWALGEQSPKLIRIKRSEDVIFAGSEKKSRQGGASVSLYLDNSEGRIPIDFEEMVISRRAYRNGESEYLINNKRVRLADIVELLAASGVSQKGYSVISQGMIDNILSSSPQERKDIFDQATGVKQYQLKARETFRRLEASQRNLTRVSDLLNEITPRLRSLRRLANKARRRGEIEERLTELQRKWYSHSVFKLKSALYQLKKEKENLDKRIFAVQDRIEEIKKKLNSTEITNQTRTEVQKKLTEKLSVFQNKRNELQKELAIIEGRLQAEQEKEFHFSKTIPVDLSYINKELEEISKIYKIIKRGWNEAEKKNDFSNIEKHFENLGKKLDQILNQVKSGCAGNPDKISSSKLKEKNKAIIQKFQEDREKIKKQLQKFEKLISKARADIEEDFRKNQTRSKEFFIFQDQLRRALEEINKKKDARRTIEIEEARIETRLEDLTHEIESELGSCGTELQKPKEQIDEEKIKNQIEKMKSQLAQIGGIDPNVLDECRETEERYNFLSSQSEDLRKAEASLMKTITWLRKKIESQFQASFKNINKDFNRYFRLIFGGGHAELKIQAPSGTVPNYSSAKKEKIENSEDIHDSRFMNSEITNSFSSKGIEIKVSLPDKRIKGIAMFSGGERALISIAILFAIISNNPPPFSILDEIDAALDEANSQKLGKILKELAPVTQFILITHNRQIMQQANTLYGVTMGEDGVSKLVSVKLDDKE